MSGAGRFAPSPTGPLHIGSLVTAVASYLQARKGGDRWLLRIEDVDPPREMPGAAERILRQLEALSLHWDSSVLYQSRRTNAYRAAAESLLQQGHAFHCSCTRRELRRHGAKAGAYPGTCRNRRQHSGPTAIRMRLDNAPEAFEDILQGTVAPPPSDMCGDYIIYRRDGLPAYHLAVVVDDAHQGITEIVRGADLLDSTFAHRHLQSVLRYAAPTYAHVPIVVGRDGSKLSKQTGAAPIDTMQPHDAATQALELLGYDVPEGLAGAPPAEIWSWALEQWQLERLAGVRSVPLKTTAAQ